MRRSLALIAAPLVILTLGSFTAAPAGASTIATSTPVAGWTPQPASYGEGTELNQPVAMSDGTVLRADVFYPEVPPATERTSL